jgi:predicted AlkP superfamily phosphohydrolase/phosphomutase
MTKERIFIMGIDAATFDVLMPLVERGELPTFSKLIKEGVSGQLFSVTPPITAPAWGSFATGKKPGKHGLFDFYYRQEDSYDILPINSSRLRSKPFWNILSEKGKKVGVINVPYTYPPDNVNGFMITGKLTPRNESNFAHPTRLKYEIKQEVGGYRIDLNEWYAKGNEDAFIRDLHQTAENRARTTLYLMKKYEWDVFTVVFTIIDEAMHWVWRYMDPKNPKYNAQEAKRYGNVLNQLYKKMDEVLKRILENLSDATIFIISDHGAGPNYKFLHINNWLMDLGLLKVKRNPLSQAKLWMFKHGINPEKIYDLLMKLGLSNLIERRGSEKRGRTLRMLRKIFLSFLDIDWSKTKAYSFGHVGPIYINLKGREPKGIVKPGKEYETLQNFLVDELYKLEDPETGERIVDKVFRREELYAGPYVDDAPDIMFLPKDTYTALGDFEFLSNSLVSPSYWSGSHRMNGIIIMKGPCIKKGVTIEKAQLIDVAPTILYLLGLPIPSDMDGRVLVEAIEPSHVLLHPIKYENVEPKVMGVSLKMTREEEQKVIERLRALGYLG